MRQTNLIVDGRKTICYNTNKCLIIFGCEMAERRKRRSSGKNKKRIVDDNTIHKNKYGFIEIENPVYYNNNFYFAPPEFLMRKPTPEERMEIVINYIIKHSGQRIDTTKLAQKLAVSKRTIQSLMSKLKAEGLIAIEPTFDDFGCQGHNKYSYIGPPVEKFGSGLTIGMLYDPKNRAGFRDWEWDEYSFKYKGHYDLNELYNAKCTRRVTRSKFISSRGGDPSCCIGKPKFIAIRYSHFIKSKPEERRTPEEYFRINYITGEQYDCRPGSLSTDGTKKFKIDFSKPRFDFALFGIPFACELVGSEDDPRVNIFHARTEEEYGQFSYWGANTLHFVWDAEDGRDEHLNIIGEFTSK